VQILKDESSSSAMSANKKNIIVVITAVMLAACSKQAWYTGAQSSQTTHCMKEPLSEYDDCIEQSGESYEQYKQKREDLMKEKPGSE